MSSVPVLALPDFTTPFIVETDAYGYELGAVLKQKQWLLACYSCIICPSQAQVNLRV